MKYDKDDIFRNELGDKLRGFREEPPQGMFERIEQTLVASGVVQPAAPTEEVRPKVVPLWQRGWMRGLTASVAAAVVVVAVVLGLRQSEHNGLLGEYGAMLCSDILPLDAPTLGVEEPRLPLRTLAVRHPEVPTSEQSVGEIVALGEPVGEQIGQNTPAGEQTAQTSSKKERKSRRTNRTFNHEKDAELEAYWRSVLGEEPRKRGVDNPLQMGFYQGNVGFNRGDVQLENVAHNDMLVKESSQIGGGSFSSPTMQTVKTQTKLQHSMPISLGVSLNYHLTDWLSVDSGLIYTSLSSTGQSSGQMSNYTVFRDMNYVGIPLGVSFHFVRLQRLDLYGRLGVVGEMNVAASDTFNLDRSYHHTTELNPTKWTFSADASIGASYAIFGAVSLFGEVGCNYWNTPDGYPENYRTVNPFGFATRFGLKYTFNK